MNCNNYDPKKLFYYALLFFLCAVAVTFLALDIDLKGTLQNQNKQYYVGWGTLALINAGIAQGKDKSGFNWFVASLFLGPFATFLLVISDTENKVDKYM